MAQQRSELDIALEFNDKDARKIVENMTKQVSSVKDAIERSVTQHDSFITTRQLSSVRKTFAQIDADYTAFMAKRTKLEDGLIKRMRDGIKNVNTYTNKASTLEASGARPAIVDHYNKRALAEKERLKRTFSLKDRDYDQMTRQSGHMSDEQLARKYLGRVNALNIMNSAMPHLQNLKNDANNQQQQSGNLYENTYGLRRLRYNTRHALMSTGAILSVGQAISSIHKHSDIMKIDEREAMLLGQRMNSNSRLSDADIRKRVETAGIGLGYTAQDTLKVQNMLASGGTLGMTDDSLQKDTQATQRFARAYAVDPNEMAGTGALLKQMGTLDDGDMQKFANLIGGAVTKGGMQGREGEMVRATASLAKSVGNSLGSLSKQQLGNIVALQTAVGEANPTLRGERGASLLSSMDNAIKNGDTSVDLLMGLGSNPKYSGIEGSFELELAKERGISDPENMKTILSNANRFSGGNKSMKHAMIGKFMKDHGFMSANQYKMLKESGVLDKLERGEVTNEQYQEALEAAGKADEASRMNKVNKTNTIDRDVLNAKDQQLGKGISAPLESGWRGIKNVFHELPTPLRYGVLAGGAMAGIGLGDAASRRLLRFIRPFLNPAGGGGAGGGAGGGTGGGLLGGLRHYGSALLTRLSSLSPALGGAVGSGASRISSMLGGLMDNPLGRNLTAAGLNMTRNASGALGSFGGKALTMAGYAVRRAPVIGTIAGYALDRIQNGETNTGRSAFKAIGGGIGTAAGLGLAGLLGIGTGGAGLLAGGVLGGGGGWAGSKLGDMAYSAIYGDEDLKRQKLADDSQQVQQTENTVPQQADAGVSSLSAKSINVQSINIADKDLATLLSARGSSVTTNPNGLDIDPMLAKAATQHVIKFEITGDIKGMSSANQKNVSDSLINYVKGLVSSSGYDLSYDVVRV